MLVLDEPTNHLDRSAKRWLMEELERFTGAVLLISHDLRLLDRSITKILNLANSELTEHPGTYTAFRANVATIQAQRERASALEGRQITRLKERADSMRGSSAGRGARRCQSPRHPRRPSRNRENDSWETRAQQRSFRLPTPRRSASVPMIVDKLSVRYDGPEVLRSVSFVVGRGDRVAVVGRNGAGKSSLLRCLAGEQHPSSGSVSTGVNVTIGYFAERARATRSHDHGSRAHRRLGSHHRSRAKGVARRVRARRGNRISAARDVVGRRTRPASLAMLAAGYANLLVLDEPTNNLDPGSVEAVGAMLCDWPGTLIVVSHDRRFVAALQPTHCLLLPSERFDLWREENLDEAELR